MRTGTSAHRQRSARGGARASSPATELARTGTPECGRGRPRTATARFGARRCAGVLARNGTRGRTRGPECGRGVLARTSAHRHRQFGARRCAGVLARNGTCTRPECGRGRPRTARVRPRRCAGDSSPATELARVPECGRGRPRTASVRRRAEVRVLAQRNSTRPECGRGRPRTASAVRCAPPEVRGRPRPHGTCTRPECGRGRPRTASVRRGRNADGDVRAGFGARRCAGVLARNGTCAAGMRTGTSSARTLARNGTRRGRNADGDVRAPPAFGPRRCAGVLARNGTRTRPECGRGRPRTARVRRAEVRGRPRPQRNLHAAGMRTGTSAHRQGSARGGARASSPATELDAAGMRTGTSAHRQRSARGGARASSPATELDAAGMRTGTSAHRQRSATLHGGARASSPATELARGRNADGDVRAPPRFTAVRFSRASFNCQDGTCPHEH